MLNFPSLELFLYTNIHVITTYILCYFNNNALIIIFLLGNLYMHTINSCLSLLVLKNVGALTSLALL